MPPVTGSPADEGVSTFGDEMQPMNRAAGVIMHDQFHPRALAGFGGRRLGGSQLEAVALRPLHRQLSFPGPRVSMLCHENFRFPVARRAAHRRDFIATAVPHPGGAY